MPRKPKTTPPEPRIAKGEGIAFPPKRDKPQVSVGVKSVRRQDAGGSRPRTTTAFSAAEACSLFGRPRKGGGASFVRWLQTEKGMRGDEKMSAADWQPLLEEFAGRPIHGHRRTRAGGNHRINKQHRR